MLLVFAIIPMTLVTILVHPASAQQIRNRRLPPAVKKKPSGLMLPDNATSIRENIVDTFSCERRIYGYYADVGNECQIFHVCVPRSRRALRFSFICPAETVFNQITFVCTRDEDSIPCAESERYYNRNEIFGKENEQSTQTSTTTSSQNNGTDISSTSSRPSARPTRPTTKPSTTRRPTPKPTTTTTTTSYPSSTQTQPSSTQQRPTWRPTTMGYLPNTQPASPQQRPTTRPTTTAAYPPNTNLQETSTSQWTTSRPPSAAYPPSTYPQRPQTPQARPPSYPNSVPNYQTTSYPLRPTKLWYYSYGIPLIDHP